MSDKETFANAFDRIIYSCIEAITGAQDESPTDPDVYAVKLDGGLVVTMSLKYSCVFKVVRTADQEVLYKRVDGNTEICRPGDWAYAVFHDGWTILKRNELENLENALERAKEKSKSFDPV